MSKEKPMNNTANIVRRILTLMYFLSKLIFLIPLAEVYINSCGPFKIRGRYFIKIAIDNILTLLISSRTILIL